MVHSLEFLLLLCSIISLSGVRHVSCARNELVATADCVCPGETFVYECSIVGGLFTVWTGSIFESGCEITLIHREYTQNGGARAVCNSGDVVGQSIGVDNDCYRSQLSVEVSTGINGSTVECTEDDGVTTTLIGTETILLSRAPFPPPSAVVLADVKPGRLTFTWTPPPLSCPSLTYNVIGNNCGTCVNNPVSANTTCTEFPLPNVCTLTVQSVICGTLASTSIDRNVATVTLKVPSAPRITSSIPFYSDSDGRLLRINTTWATTEAFMISDTISGSASSYTIVYRDSIFGTVCGRVEIVSASCENGVCQHLFDSFTSECSANSDIEISVSATNALGEGPSSPLILHGGTNDFVEIGFNPDILTLTCEFTEQSLRFAHECLINITYGDNCEEQLDVYTTDLDSDTGLLVTPRIDLVNGVSRYCFSATANSGNTTMIIEGTFNLFGINIGITTAAAVVPVVLIICIFVVLISTILLWQRYKTSIVIIRFSNPDETGSLAAMLKVFKDNGVNILTINKVPTADDVSMKVHFLGSRTMTDTFVTISCTKSDKMELRNNEKYPYLQMIEDKGQKLGFDGSDDDGQSECVVKFLLQIRHRSGSLWEVMEMFAKRGIKILGLNTRSNYSKNPGYKDNYVYCRCSKSTCEKICERLQVAGAQVVEEEVYRHPLTRMLQFYVRDEPGCLAEALKAFQALNINLTGTNPAFLKSNIHEVFKHETVYIECDIVETQREGFTKELFKNEAMAVKCFNHNDHCVLKMSIPDRVGSLVRTLEIFKEHGINILGVNTFEAEPDVNLRPSLHIEYKRILIEFTSFSSDDNVMSQLTDKLQATGLITDVKATHGQPAGKVEESESDVKCGIEFLARHEVGTLVKALTVFAEHSLNIADLHQEDTLSKDFVYVHNHVRFIATDQQEQEIIRKLYATGLVVDVKRFNWDGKTPPKITDPPDHQYVEIDSHIESKV